MKTRLIEDRDADGIMALVRRCYGEYEGVVFEPDGVDADLNAYASAIANLNGHALVVEQENKIVALVSGAPISDARYQLRKIYVDATARGSGLAKNLLAEVEKWAAEHGAETLELWSDTRFERAHRFYEREGFKRQTETRALHDLSNTIEYQFIKKMDG